MQDHASMPSSCARQRLGIFMKFEVRCREAEATFRIPSPAGCARVGTQRSLSYATAPRPNLDHSYFSSAGGGGEPREGYTNATTLRLRPSVPFFALLQANRQA